MRKSYLLLSLIVVFSLLLSACAGAAPAAPAAPADTEAEAEAPAEGEAAAEEPTVDPNAPTPEPTPVVNAVGECDDPMTFWHGLTGSDGLVFAEMMQAYGEANPDACFEAQGIAWDLFFQKYPTAVAAGTPPDLVAFHAAEVQQMAAQGLMQPMDDWYESTGIGKDQFNEALMGAIEADGATMAVPFDNHGWMLWKNDKVIEDAGLDPNALPTNGEEFIEWAKQITTDVNGLHPDDEGFDPDNVAVWAYYPTWPRFTYPSLWMQFGGGAINADATQATLDSPESIAAVQYMHDLMWVHHVMPPQVPGVPYGGELYQNNAIALWWEGTWTGGYMRDRPDVAAVTSPAPLNSFSPDGTQGVKFDSHIFSIPTGVDDEGKAQAYSFIQYMLENGAYWANSGQVPALKSVQESAEVQAIESVAVAAQQFNDFGATDPVANHPAFLEIQQAWETAVTGVLADPNGDVAAALAEGNAQIQAILDRP
jgi:ABC-type glycerol-3-phosphate transport system substrate-binding protein